MLEFFIDIEFSSARYLHYFFNILKIIYNYFTGKLWNFIVPRVPNTNFAYNTSRAQRGMFCRQNWYSWEPEVK